MPWVSVMDYGWNASTAPWVKGVCSGWVHAVLDVRSGERRDEDRFVGRRECRDDCFLKLIDMFVTFHASPDLSADMLCRAWGCQVGRGLNPGGWVQAGDPVCELSVCLTL